MVQHRKEILIKMNRNDLISYIEGLYEELNELYSGKEEYREDCREAKRKTEHLLRDLGDLRLKESTQDRKISYLDGQISTLVALLNIGKSDDERICLERPFDI